MSDATALVGSTDNYNQMIDYVTSNEANINDPEVYKTITTGWMWKTLLRWLPRSGPTIHSRQHQILARENAGRQMALDLVRFLLGHV